MSNAQILLVVRGSITAESLRSAVEAAGRAAGFLPGPSTWASGSSTAIRQGIVGVFSTGPWLGFEFPGETLPTVPSNVEWSAIRMNLLGGPDGSAALDAVGNALRAMPATIRMASRSPRNAISWDRGVPAGLAISESASTSSSSTGWLMALTVAGVVAWNVRASVGGPAGTGSRRGFGRLGAYDPVKLFEKALRSHKAGRSDNAALQAARMLAQRDGATNAQIIEVKKRLNYYPAAAATSWSDR